jgi:transposase InsO family protein
MKYQAIRNYVDRFDVRLMCRALQVSHGGYYEWLKRPESARARQNRALLVEIRAAHERSHRNYGSPRITRELRQRGRRCGKNRVARLMRAHGLRAKRVKRWRATTQSNHRLAVAANTLARQFTVSRPNQVWAADISYLWTEEGWLYLAVVLDLYSRAVIGWAMGPYLTTQLATGALKMALRHRTPERGLLHHSDRGVQYAARDYQRLLEEHGIACSMSRKGNCWDNACVESFFSTLKVEHVYHQRYATREQAKHDVFRWIELIYNRQRRHSTLGYRSPAEFEAMREIA